MHTLPAVLDYQLTAMWSINERLAGRPGTDMPRPTLDWYDSLERVIELEDVVAKNA